MRLIERLMRLIGFKDLKEIGPAKVVTPAPAAPVAAATPAEGAAADRAGQTVRRFIDPETLAKLPEMRAKQLDALGFGCVKVSDVGLVQFYNQWEADFAGVAKEDAVGRNFFRELAPCTNNRLIFGRFKEGIAAGQLDVMVQYAFTYKMKPTLVDVHLYRHPETKTNWVLVQRTEAGK